MCDLRRNYIAPTATVYKVAIKNNSTGKYYSPATGIEYKVGPVEVCDSYYKACENVNRSNYFRLGNIYDDNGGAYTILMKGRTAGFVELEHAEYLRKNIAENKTKVINLVILKLQLSDSLMLGYYNMDDVIAGKYINSITELK